MTRERGNRDKDYVGECWRKLWASWRGRITLVVRVALCRMSPGQKSCDATVTAVRLRLTLPPASKVVSRLCSSWNTYLRTALWMRAKMMEKPPNPSNISSAVWCFSNTACTLTQRGRGQEVKHHLNICAKVCLYMCVLLDWVSGWIGSK